MLHVSVSDIKEKSLKAKQICRKVYFFRPVQDNVSAVLFC